MDEQTLAILIEENRGLYAESDPDFNEMLEMLAEEASKEG